MSRLTVPLVVAAVVVAGVGGLVLAGGALPLATPDTSPSDSPADEPAELVRSPSQAAFASYVARSRELATKRVFVSAGASDVTGGDGGVPDVEREAALTTTVAEATTTQSGGGADDEPRVSGTNVQETGIDEPDVLKAGDGHFYFAGGPGDGTGKWVYADTHVVSARPPGNATKVGEIDRAGDLLLANDTLVVIGDDRLTGYDVADPAHPEEAWSRSLNGTVRTARLQDGTAYLVVATGLDDRPCPVEPLEGASVACTDILHSSEPTPVDVTYTVVALDPASGDVDDTLSLLGSRRSVVYMSEDGLYTSYVDRAGRGEVTLDFLLSDGRSLLDDRSIERLEEIERYDLSDRATWVEVEAVVRSWLQSHDETEREDLVDELGERYRDYLEEHRRGLSTTHVVKIGVDDGLDVAATGSVPGTPLNQWSFDVHDGHLRVATTVNAPDMWTDVPTVNDVYVLDENLDVTGSVTGMGEDQRIYGVRFVGDTGYVITFRRVDPLHVLDLSDPQSPTEEGELKLPGFSTYLHPLDDGRVLGIGEEEGRVKAVVFDVSDPQDPTVADSRVLDARFSAVSRTHHAFLLDARHEVFFLPTEEGGHVFSYADGLDRVHTVDVRDPRRAAYVGDYLYVFGGNELVVVDETTWERVRSVDLL